MRGTRAKAFAAGAAVASAAVTVALLGGSGAGAASPASTGYEFVGWSGGSLVRAADNTITSDLTAASSINNEGLVSDSDSAGSVLVNNLLNTGAVSTSTASTAIDGGYKVVSEARTAHISALGGLITADAIDTVSTATVVNNIATHSVQSTLLNLKVGNTHVPANVRPNTIIRIPNVATVSLNYSLSFAKDNSSYNIGIGAYVSLLKPRGENAVGAELAISPTYAALGPVIVPPSGHFLYGNAYGTKVAVQVGSLAGIRSDETAPITMAAAGTDGTPQTSQTAGVHLNPAAGVGAVTDTVNGTNTSSAYDGQASSRIGAVNLLNGLIKADAIGSLARVRGPASATVPTVSGASTLVNLVINGKPISVNTAPNSQIRVLNLGLITINQQIRPNNRSIIVRALDIKLSTAAYGFPAGAEIQVAVSRVSVS
jgi:hypothetical protein